VAAALDVAEIGGSELGFFCEFFLGEAAQFSVQAYFLAEEAAVFRDGRHSVTESARALTCHKIYLKVLLAVRECSEENSWTMGWGRLLQKWSFIKSFEKVVEVMSVCGSLADFWVRSGG
jgi:hypothetical protein